MTATELRSQLDQLDRCYAAVLHLAADVGSWSAASEPGLGYSRQYATRHYVRMPGVLSGPALEHLVDRLWPVLLPMSFPVSVPHRAEGGSLTSGGRLRRVDGHSLDGEQGQAMDKVLEAIGVAQFGRLLAQELAPVLKQVIGPVRYERLFINLYTEGDYLTGHDDAHMGERIDVNVSATLDASSGLRVLIDGMFETQYDGGGTIGILGPRVWHEVPPLLRQPDGPPPRRMTLTMRYWPAG